MLYWVAWAACLREYCGCFASVGGVDSLIKSVVLVILEQISGWCAGQYRVDGALFIKLFLLNTRAK